VKFAVLRRQRLHFVRHDGKAATGIACACRLDCGVERQQVGLAGDHIDRGDDLADAGRDMTQHVDIAGCIGDAFEQRGRRSRPSD